MTYETTMEAVLRAMEDDMGEPLTPKEIAEHKVGMAIRDAWLASAGLFKLRCDPIAAPFVAKAEGDLWSIKLRIDAMISEIRAEHGERELPHLKVVSRG
jgi:hypothetical protein